MRQRTVVRQTDAARRAPRRLGRRAISEDLGRGRRGGGGIFGGKHVTRSTGFGSHLRKVRVQEGTIDRDAAVRLERLDLALELGMRDVLHGEERRGRNELERW